MKQGKSFWLTWPVVLVFLPFMLFSVVLLGVAGGIFPHPPELSAITPGVRIWALKTFFFWLGTALVLYATHSVVRERGEK
ncbi:hypothetical protein Adeg_1901 [Ammonifex degensii KC4]|uniref:Uncharacterized protein n=1 Tax=Ammonifex degensii (strain DSM 10501 / KC4) TaxID=429009 RepID=C9R9K2_AMMDK|nr:hypothetical protein Adeg_1901 [Ammonifex degensii KC4]